MIYLAKKKEQKEKSLEQTLYDTAELQRGKVAPSDYKDIALGLLFLKFISYWYDQRRTEIEKETKDESEKNRNYLLNLKTNYTSKGVFFLKKGDRWDDLKQIASSEPNLAIKIDGILQQIEKDNPSLEKVLPDVFATSEVKNDNLQQLIENFDSIKTNEVSKVIRKYGVDQIFIALPLNSHDKMEEIINYLSEETVDIKVVPDLLKFMNIF